MTIETPFMPIGVRAALIRHQHEDEPPAPSCGECSSPKRRRYFRPVEVEDDPAERRAAVKRLRTIRRNIERAAKEKARAIADHLDLSEDWAHAA